MPDAHQMGGSCLFYSDGGLRMCGTKDKSPPQLQLFSESPSGQESGHLGRSGGRMPKG